MVARITLRLASPVLGAILLVSVVAAYAWDGTGARVLDGDSFRVQHGGRMDTIRLYGIDAPEYDQAGGQEAKKLTSALVRGKKVTIAPMDTDRYGRTVALVQAREVWVNAELVRAGLAWVYPQYCKAQPLCRDLEILQEQARSRQLGLWRDSRPAPPWVWKRQRH